MATDITCFLIDDDEDDCEIFTLALEDANKSYKCITAINGKDALDKLHADETFIPDFIFLDLNMPVMNGKTFLKEIKSVPHLVHIPVVIYTTSSYEKDIEETKDLGAAHYLVKPSNIDTLTKILSELFRKQYASFSIDQH